MPRKNITSLLTLILLCLSVGMLPNQLKAQSENITVGFGFQGVFNRYHSTGRLGLTSHLEKAFTDSRLGWSINFGVMRGTEESKFSYRSGSDSLIYTSRTNLLAANFDFMASLRLTPAKSVISITPAAGFGLGFIDFKYPKSSLLENYSVISVEKSSVTYVFPMFAATLSNKFNLTDQIHFFLDFHMRWGLGYAPGVEMVTIHNTKYGHSTSTNKLESKETMHGFSFGFAFTF